MTKPLTYLSATQVDEIAQLLGYDAQLPTILDDMKNRSRGIVKGGMTLFEPAEVKTYFVKLSQDGVIQKTEAEITQTIDTVHPLTINEKIAVHSKRYTPPALSSPNFYAFRRAVQEKIRGQICFFNDIVDLCKKYGVDADKREHTEMLHSLGLGKSPEAIGINSRDYRLRKSITVFSLNDVMRYFDHLKQRGYAVPGDIKKKVKTYIATKYA